jgi:hypothetical protein
VREISIMLIFHKASDHRAEKNPSGFSILLQINVNRMENIWLTISVNRENIQVSDRAEPGKSMVIVLYSAYTIIAVAYFLRHPKYDVNAKIPVYVFEFKNLFRIIPDRIQ